MNSPTSAELRAAAKLYLYQRDFRLFARHDLKIKPKASPSLVPFTLRPYQEQLLAAILDQRSRRGYVRQVWLKGRQVGTSTLSQGLLFWRTALFSNVSSIVVAHDGGIAQELFSMSQRFYDKMSPELRPMVRYRTKGSIEFENPNDRDRLRRPGLNSKITISTAKNIHSGAGGTYNNVQLSEAARYVNPEEIVASTLQTVPQVPDTYVIVESTARPEGAWFHDLCVRAMDDNPNNPYEFHFVGMQHDPTCVEPMSPEQLARFKPTRDERHIMKKYGLTPQQITWRRIKLAGEFKGDELLLSQEYPLAWEEAWIPKGYAVFPTDQLAKVAEGVSAPKFRCIPAPPGRVLMDSTGPLEVWEEPRDGLLYDIGVDTAMGVDDGDWSVACVVHRDTQQQVAMLRCRMEPTEFTTLVAWLGWYYNVAQVNVEITGASGYFVNTRLNQELSYPNLYLWRRRDYVTPYITKSTGWEQQSKAKKYLISLGKDRLFRWAGGEHERFPLVRSDTLLQEMRVFVKLPEYMDSYGATPGAHDDCVIAWLLAIVSADDELSGMQPSTKSLDLAPTADHDPWKGHESRSLRPDEIGVGARSEGWWGDVDGWV